MITGVLAALGGSFCWATCSVFFSSSVRRLGVYGLNLVRLPMALGFLALALWIWKGTLLLEAASGRDWMWLALSALVGLVIGDLFYFGALRSIGPRVTLLLFTLAPPVAAAGEWLILDHPLRSMALAGMAVALVGVTLVISDRPAKGAKNLFTVTSGGILLGAAAAFCQGAGLVFSKLGLQVLDPLSGTFIRMLVAAPTFAAIYFLLGGRLETVSTQRRGLAMAFVGAFFGPFLGVTLSLAAVKNIHAGIAMTLLSTTPITVLPYAILVYKERLTLKAVLGAVLAVAGVGLLCAG